MGTRCLTSHLNSLYYITFLKYRTKINTNCQSILFTEKIHLICVSLSSHGLLEDHWIVPYIFEPIVADGYIAWPGLQ